MVMMAGVRRGSGRLIVNPCMDDGADDAARIAYSWVRLHEDGR